MKITVAFFLGLVLCCGGPPARAGWSWKLPPNAVSLLSGKRAMIFEVDEPIIFAVKGGPATRYQVRNYYGDLVDQGPVGLLLAVRAQPPGWYKVNVFGEQDQGLPWGRSVGGTMFAVVRHDPQFPPMPDKSLPGGADGIDDQPTRDFLGIGPERLAVPDASKPDDAIRTLEEQVAIGRKLYLPFDPYRKRALLIAFSKGTQDLAGVRKIVAHFQNDVEYWEPRNEPNYGASGADFARQEMKPFYDTVKSVNPKLKVMGPGTVSITPAGGLLPWIEDFLKAGGGKDIDVFSFHAYNSVNGDIEMARLALDRLQALLTKYGLRDIEKWQTEQGYFAAVYGAYQPRLQGRWTMDQMMVYEQYGIPKEHNHLWYDLSHGFWDAPAWWENEDHGVNPAAPLMRVWAEELYGTRYAGKFDFGPAGNEMYLGSSFSGPGKKIAVFLSAGDPYGAVNLTVTGSGPLHIVSPFGITSTLPVNHGKATLPVSELPEYVELAPSQAIHVQPFAFGPDLARRPGVTADRSGPTAHSAGDALNLSKLTNGLLENWYYTQQPDSLPFMDDTWPLLQSAPPPLKPAWVTITLPAPARISRVIIYAAPPWQPQSSLLDFELQYDLHGQWKTLERVREPTKTFPVYSPSTRTIVDCYYSDRWVFPIHFPAVTTAKIRLLVHNATFGGGADKSILDAGGQANKRDICLREIEIYGR